MSEEPIVVGVDGSPESRAAVRWAAREAALHGRELRILTAVPVRDDARLTERATDLLTECRDLAQATARGVRADTRLVPAGPVDALVAAAETAVMLVVGRRPRGPLADLVLGSVTREVTARAPGVTVVVRASREERTGGQVVAGVDGSASSAHALDVALEEAHLRGVGLNVVYAEAGWMPPHSSELVPAYTPEVEMDAARDRLDHWLKPRIDRWPGVPVHRRVLPGAAAVVLTDASAEAALLVIGAQGHGEAGTLLGSVSHGVIHHATCPVALVRPR